MQHPRHQRGGRETQIREGGTPCAFALMLCSVLLELGTHCPLALSMGWDGEALTPEERAALDAAVPPKRGHPPHSTLGDYLKALAKLGGWLARAHDGPPGNMVIWRGWRRLEDIVFGFKIAKTYG